MIEKWKELAGYKDFFLMLVYQQLHQRYQGSVLGFLWTLLNPLLIYVSFTIIFSYLNNWDLKDYGIYFFSGYAAWNFFAVSCQLAAESVVGNTAFVTRVYAPKALFPLAAVAVSLVDFAASFVILLILLIAFQASVSWTLLFLPVSVLILALFTAGASLLCAMWNVVFRDFRHLLGSLLFIWFFFSPILWKSSAMPAGARRFFDMNPIIPFLNLFQGPIWRGELPSPETLGISLAMALLVLMAGFAAFFRSEKDFYYYL